MNVMSPKRIYTLDPLLANQIAAGEVIERPASVVKELLENSLDAGSTELSIHIERAGTQLIQIRDNGSGIHPEDLPLAVTCHATSKIKTWQELQRVRSLGFRGEALASIAAVSRLILTSRIPESDHGWELTVEGRIDISAPKPAQHPYGTTVAIYDLFFNTPARRRFLKSERTEFDVIEGVVRRLALSQFGVRFHLTHDDKMILQLPAVPEEDQKIKRIGKLFGQAFIHQSFYIDTEITGLRCYGWISAPEFSRSQGDWQYCYINGRPVRDKLILHAVKQAYSDVLPEGRHSVYALYLELDPQEVDVNIHPTKAEVRFAQPRLVHDFIYQVVRRLFTNHQVTVDTEFSAVDNSVFEKPFLHTQQVRTPYERYSSYSSGSSSTRHAPSFPQENIQWIGSWQHFGWLIYEKNLFLIDAVRYYQYQAQTSLLKAWKSYQQWQSKALLIPERIRVARPVLDSLLTQKDVWKKFAIEYDAIAEDLLLIRALPEDINYIDPNKLINWMSAFKLENYSEKNADAIISGISGTITLPETFSFASVLVNTLLTEFSVSMTLPFVRKLTKEELEHFFK